MSDGSTRNRLINKPKFIYDDPTRKTSAPKLNEPDPALDALALSRERLLPGKPLDWVPPLKLARSRIKSDDDASANIYCDIKEI